MDVSEFTARSEHLKERLYRTAYLYLGSESAALDAVDETVYRALKSFKRLRQPQYFDTWMTRILINECYKELRRIKRERPVETLPEAQPQQLDTLPLKEAIRALPQDLMQVIILRFFTGYTLAETARSLAIPQGTVATRQRRALALLKLELSQEE